LDIYALATTAKPSTDAQEKVFEINQKHRAEGLFHVELLHWRELEDLLDEYAEVREEFYKGLDAAQVTRISEQLSVVQHTVERSAPIVTAPQKWISKRYVAGKSITSGWLAFFIFVVLFVVIISALLWVLHGLATMTHPSSTNWLLYWLCLISMFALFLIAGLAKQVSSRGFVGVPHTQIGIARDIDRHVFVAKLGGEGSLCPICRAKLHFHNLGTPPVVRCTHNSDHWWAFDFTRVEG
jgi:hypothetical protein